MITSNYTIAGLDLPHLPAQDRLSRLLTASLPPSGVTTPLPRLSEVPLWLPSFYGLDRVDIFQSASEAEQQAILQRLNQNLLQETYYVERIGVGYTAKMILESDSVEERMLYALFAAQEATHLAQISRVISQPESSPVQDSFIGFLSELVESSDKVALLLLVQVLLEGWGLSHYRSLAQTCQHPQVAAIFQSFLADEIRHHATGLVACQTLDPATALTSTLLEVLSQFLWMVQIGPQQVVSTIEQIKGYLSVADKIQLFTDLETESHSGSRLALLRSILDRAFKSSTFVETLAAKNLFIPYTPAQCARIG